MCSYSCRVRLVMQMYKTSKCTVSRIPHFTCFRYGDVQFACLERLWPSSHRFSVYGSFLFLNEKNLQVSILSCFMFTISDNLIAEATIFKGQWTENSAFTTNEVLLFTSLFTATCSNLITDRCNIIKITYQEKYWRLGSASDWSVRCIWISWVTWKLFATVCRKLNCFNCNVGF